jgi:hypothetical protein
MVNVDLSWDLIALDAYVATIVSCDDVVTNLAPLSRLVERLIQPTIEAESFDPNRSTKSKVLVSFFVAVDATQL